MQYTCDRTKHRSTKEKMDRSTPMKTEQALNGLYPAVLMMMNNIVCYLKTTAVCHVVLV